MLLVKEHREYFGHKRLNLADSLCDKLHPVLNNFVDEREVEKPKVVGTEILLELNNFSSIIKKLVDTQAVKTT